MKTFLAAGDVFLNDEMLAYAVIETDSEGLRLRLGFTGTAAAEPREILVTGSEARAVLRWLRTNAEFLDSGGPSYRGSRRGGPVIGWHTEELPPGRLKENRPGCPGQSHRAPGERPGLPAPGHEDFAPCTRSARQEAFVEFAENF
jgi:hypothetical protein